MGANPPAALVALQAAVTNEVIACCGIPPAIFDSGASAGAMRESFRQLRYATLAPLGIMVAAELSRKLESQIELGWGRLNASDLSGRSRAYSGLVGAGMPPASAAQVCQFD